MLGNRFKPIHSGFEAQSSIFGKIMDWLAENDIRFMCYQKDIYELYAYEYPKDLRIFYQDIDYKWENGNIQIRHTGKFYYSVCWNFYGRTSIEKAHCNTQGEVIKLIKEINKQFNATYKQLTLL